jgi:hypothetical protein
MSALFKLYCGLAAKTLSILQETAGAEKVSVPGAPSSKVTPVRGAETKTFGSGVGSSVATGLGSAHPARIKLDRASREKVFRSVLFTKAILVPVS